MVDYIRHEIAVHKMYTNLDNMINSNLLENREVIMFGTSKIASMIVYYLQQNKICVKSIVDNDKKRWNQEVWGLKVYPPDYYQDNYNDKCLFLIASSYQNEMINQLQEYGYKSDKHIIKVIDLPEAMNDYSFADRTEYREMSDTDIRISQTNVLKHLKHLCEQNNLRYYLCGGTLLGAVRHKGYIPWDDDIDVVMPADDIVKLVKLLNEDTEYGIVSCFGNMDYFDECSMMYDRSNICDVNHFPMQMTLGMWIDIFPFFGMPDGDEEISEYAKTAKYMEADKWNKIYSGQKCQDALKEQLGYLMGYDYDNSPNIGFLLSRYFMKDVFPAKYFKKAVKVLFEGEYYDAPEDWDLYLKKIYGDYMQLPPIEQQVGHHYFKAYYKK